MFLRNTTKLFIVSKARNHPPKKCYNTRRDVKKQIYVIHNSLLLFWVIPCIFVWSLFAVALWAAGADVSASGCCVRRERFHEKPERTNPDPARESRILWPAGGRLQTDCKTRAPIVWPPSSTWWDHAARGQRRSTDVLCLINKWARRLGNGNFNARNRLYSVLPQAKRWWSEPPTSLIASIPNSFLALGP